MENKPGDKALVDHRADDQALLKKAKEVEQTSFELLEGDKEINKMLKDALQSAASTATNTLTD